MGYRRIDKTRTAEGEAMQTSHTLPSQLKLCAMLNESLGLLVMLGFDVTVFTPASYQRRSLRRPSREI